MRIRNFIILNILGSILELSFIMYILHFFDPIYTYIYLLFFTTLVIIQITKTLKNSMFEEVKSKTNQFEEYIHLIEETKKHRNKPLYYKYVHVKEVPSPAFYTRNTVYFNTAFKQDKLLFEGILAHELGHASTRLGDVASLSVFRLSSTLSNILMMLRLQTKPSKNILFRIFDFYMYIIFLFTSLLDEIILNPFMRQDEYLANEYALKLTDGRSLRVYYNIALKQYNKQNMRYDLKHPKVHKMLDKLEEQMNLSEHEKDIYAVGTKIYDIKNAKTNTDRQNKKHNYYYHVLDHTEEVSLQLARNFEQGLGTEKDINKALDFYIKAYDLGNKRVSINIGKILMDQEMHLKAIPYLETATKENIRVAYYELGKIYENGLGIEEDLDKALDYYQEGANLQERRCIKKVNDLKRKTLLDMILN